MALTILLLKIFSGRDDAQQQIADIRAVQENNLTLVESPRDVDSVQIGHIITVEDRDGVVKEFRVGGYGGNRSTHDSSRLEYGAPLISPFMGMSVGAEVESSNQGEGYPFLNSHQKGVHDMFVVLEGIDGVGKSTVTKLVAENLTSSLHATHRKVYMERRRRLTEWLA